MSATWRDADQHKCAICGFVGIPREMFVHLARPDYALHRTSSAPKAILDIINNTTSVVAKYSGVLGIYKVLLM